MLTVLSLNDTVKNYVLCSVYKKWNSKKMYLRIEFSEQKSGFLQQLKTERHDILEILLKVGLNTMTLTQNTIL